METMTGFVIATVLAVLSAAAYAAAAVAQQRVGVVQARETPLIGGPLHRAGAWLHFLLTEKRWWLSVGLNAAGAVCHVAALRYGTLTLVQPLGALTLVLAVPLAAITASRRVGRHEWRGAAITVVGLAGIFALTSTTGAAVSRALDTTGIITLTAATGVGLVLLISAARTAGALAGPSKPTPTGPAAASGAAASLLYATAAGAAYAVASVLTKTVTDLVGHPGGLPLTLALAGIVAMALAGLLLSQSAYRNAEVAAPTAAITLVNPVVAAAIGLMLLGERLIAGTPGALLALGFAVVAGWGVIVLVSADRDGGPGGAGDGVAGGAASGGERQADQSLGAAADLFEGDPFVGTVAHPGARSIVERRHTLCGHQAQV
jgi:hypothetical protein